MISFSIPNKFTGEAIFKTDIDCSEDAPWSVKITIAARIAIKKKINLREADLRWANLREADLQGAIGLDKKPTQTVILPEGDLIVYKKLEEGVSKLLIPADAKRSNATGRKCRAEYAKVLELPQDVTEGTSKHDSKFKYRVGEMVRPDRFDPDWKNECTGGIHFFITRDEAEEY